VTPFFWLRWLRRAVVLLLVVVLAVPLVTATRIWLVSRQDDRSPADVILVLGAAQFDGVPSPVLETRLNHAQELYEDGVAPTIMTVGGKAPGDRFTEAAAGKAYLVEQGVPRADVVAVPRGRDTQESMAAAAVAMKKRDMSSVVVVTDPDHSLRTRTMGRDLGMDAWTSPARFNTAKASSPSGRRYVMRETGAYLSYVLLHRWGVQAVL
jgi:uncharacterized SAM-binding protein YcdF (DUF218 family)